MPKGALLHCHLGAMVDLGWVFDTAIETRGMCISSDIALSDREHLEAGRESIWSADYQSGTWVSLKDAADTFPNGGKEGFVEWMKQYASITQADSVEHHLGVDDIWKKLQQAFRVIGPVIFYEPITRKFLRKFWKTLLDDGVRWVEFRGMSPNFRLEGQEDLAPHKNRLELVRVINEEL